MGCGPSCLCCRPVVFCWLDSTLIRLWKSSDIPCTMAFDGVPESLDCRASLYGEGGLQGSVGRGVLLVWGWGWGRGLSCGTYPGLIQVLWGGGTKVVSAGVTDCTAGGLAVAAFAAVAATAVAAVPAVAGAAVAALACAAGAAAACAAVAAWGRGRDC